MGRIEVRKYGGSSLAENRFLIRIAETIKKKINNNPDLKIIVTVSARGNLTDSLFAGAKIFYKNYESSRELALLVSTGEIQSAAFFAMALKKIKIKAGVLLPYNIFELENDYLEGRIKKVKTEKIRQFLKEYNVCVVPGYQGINNFDEVMLMGRGGTDTTALAITAAMGIKECDIYSDIDGVYTGDPKILKNALKIDKLSYEEMKELAFSGARVLHHRAVEIARKHNIKVNCLSTFKKTEATVICKEGSMENYEITGIVHTLDEARVEITGIINPAEAMYKVFALLDNLNVSFDMLNEVIKDDKFNISFTMPRSKVLSAVSALNKLKDDIDFKEINYNLDIAKITVVGERLRNNTHASVKIMKVVKNCEAKIYMMNYSDIKLSFVIPAENFRKVLENLHSEFF
ncbi:MAG: aspartate kinase [Candidatus Muiribacteriota bacterium]